MARCHVTLREPTHAAPVFRATLPVRFAMFARPLYEERSLFATLEPRVYFIKSRRSSAFARACDGGAVLDLVIEARRKDLGGGLEVGRVLPFARRRMVGPFIFLDHMGPADFAPGQGVAVRPH